MSEALPPPIELAREPGARSEEEFQTEVRAQLRRNYLSHLCHGLLGQTGFRLLNAPTFIPTYFELLSGSPFYAGLARALQSFGMFVSPILGATVIEHRRRVLPVGFAVGAGMRVQVLCLGLAGLLLTGTWSLAASLAFLTLFGFFLGMQGVIFNFLVSKVIPVERRGFLLGLRNALAGITATSVGILGGVLVERQALGNGHAATFLVAFVLTALGLCALLFVREPESPRVREPSRIRDRLRDLPALLRSDPDFTRYFIARALATMGRMSVPFYILYAGTRTPVGGTELGWLTGAFVASQSVFNLGWGLLADRWGFRLVFVSAVSLWMATGFVLMSATTFGMLVVVFSALGAGLGGFQLSAQNLVLEFGSRHNLPLRIAVANSSSELVGAIGPLLGGALAVWVSFVSVFWTAIAFQAAALWMVLRHVREPRRKPAEGGRAVSRRRT
ncbi:MAG: MFS transporter [Myxococcota bacterium]